MEFDIVTIDPVVMNWWLLAIPVIIVALCIAAYLVAMKVLSKSEHRALRAFGAQMNTSIFAMFAFAFIGLMVGIGSISLSPELVIVPRALTTALEEQLDYTEVNVPASGHFSARNVENIPVSGRLVEIKPNVFTVVVSSQ